MTIKYDLTGFYNFREGGGMAADGGRVRTRRLLRSDFPESLDAEDVEFFQEAPTSAVIDLRTQAEISSVPRYFEEAGFDVVPVPITPGSFGSVLDALPTIPQMYQQMLSGFPGPITSGVKAVAAAVPSGAALVHCTAGKDRTGVVIALTQALLGVSDGGIVANYVQTQANLEGQWLTNKKVVLKKMLAQVPGGDKVNMDQVAAIATGSPATAIQGVLDTIRKEHGSVENFVLDHGMIQAEIDTLREELIVK